MVVEEVEDTIVPKLDKWENIDVVVKRWQHLFCKSRVQVDLEQSDSDLCLRLSISENQVVLQRLE